jgi:hypothetical protein
MPAPTRPTNFPKPFAVSGTRNTIPDAPTGTNHASFTEGFPAVTMKPITSGGVPPSGDDFNGLFYDLMTHTVWVNAGGQYQFDAALSTAMVGYPQGMILQSNDGLSSYVSLVNNNTTDFNSTPSSIGTLWGTYAGSAFSSVAVSTTGGATTLTAAQLAADVIVVSGALTSNVTLNFPSVIGKYFVVNKTTGSYLVNCVASGNSVAIKQQSADPIYCDGVNMGYQQASSTNQPVGDASKSLSSTYYSDRAADQVGGYHPDTGAVNAFVIATTPTSTTPKDGQTVRFKPLHSNTGACTLNAGFGTYPLVRGDTSPLRANDATTTGIITATFSSASSTWIVNGLLVPDVAISDLFYVTATQTLSRGNFNIDTRLGSFGCNLTSSPATGDAVRCGDYSGSWNTLPFTLVATGGLQIVCTTINGTTWSDTTLVDNVRGHQFTVYFDGTNWRLS